MYKMRFTPLRKRTRAKACSKLSRSEKAKRKLTSKTHQLLEEELQFYSLERGSHCRSRSSKQCSYHSLHRQFHRKTSAPDRKHHRTQEVKAGASTEQHRSVQYWEVRCPCSQKASPNCSDYSSYERESSPQVAVQAREHEFNRCSEECRRSAGNLGEKLGFRAAGRDLEP